MRRKIVVVLKGYPRLSETFIAQELLGLEQAGLELALVALRRPTDKKRHPVHDEIKAPVLYLPEYLHEEPVPRAAGLLRRPCRGPASGARSARSPPTCRATSRATASGGSARRWCWPREWPKAARMAACPFHPYAGLGRRAMPA